MESFEQILKTIQKLPTDCETIELDLSSAMGYVLQQNVVADIDMPPFNKSAMDGYACRKCDLLNTLEVLEVIAAGKLPSKGIGKNQCSKIMTGAIIPEGADCVFMVEDSRVIDENRVRCTNANTKLNICIKGEDYKTGDVLLKSGEIIRAEHIAVIAGVGLDKIIVSKMPEIGIIVTGTELVEHSEKPYDGKIRNTNALQLMSLCKKMFLKVNYYGIVPDELNQLKIKFKQAIEENDLVLMTGGASMGDFDLVPDVIDSAGFNTIWSRTGLKPGNPMGFYTKGKKCCFGLSGNPVSSLVQFEYLVKPVIYKILGANYIPFRFKSQLSNHFFRKKASRFGILPVHINSEGLIEQLPFNGSAHINSLTAANALMEIPADVKEIKKGEMTYVRPL